MLALERKKYDDAVSGEIDNAYPGYPDSQDNNQRTHQGKMRC
jgi:hypothetical protein